jgi:glycosyltransferase involved in cell wall biosynthesis
MLSVITPVRSQAAYLPAALDSVAAVSHQHEHLVVDAGSDDGTVDLLRTRDDPNLRWTSEPDRGQTHAVNKGLERSRGELIGWLNGDDAYLPAAVDRAIEYLEGHLETMAIYGQINYIKETGEIFRTMAPPRFSWRRYLYLGSFLPTPTVIFRRRLLAQAPFLNEAYVDAADYDFYLRLLRGARVDRIDEPLVNFRYHPTSKSSTDVWTQLDEAQAIRLGWARNPIDRTLMRSWEGAKRAVLPRISSWPHPEPTGAVWALRRLGTRS